MKLIETKTLTSAQSNITFNSIPQNFTDLYVLLSLRGDSAGNGGHVQMNLNGSTSNLSSRWLGGSGSSVGGYTSTTGTVGNFQGSNTTANTFGNHSIYISNYASSTNKSASFDSVEENNGTQAYATIGAFLWSNSAGITSLLIKHETGNMVAGSTISLYGIGGVGDGGPKATGGIARYYDGYWYHAFTASGTFTPTSSLSCDILVIAGGGSGGGGRAGGGGAGGLLHFASQTLSSTGHVVTVGAGGAGTTIFVRGNRGVNSQFGALTAAVGGGSGSSAFQGGVGPESGGSGGGSGGSFAGAAGTSGQGLAGGNASPTGENFRGAGGGGGAGQSGGNGSDTVSNAGTGGDGVSTYSSYGLATSTGQNISGTVWYAGGGGGGAFHNGSPVSPGGKGGGGAAGWANIISGAGLANTGGGSGGAGNGGGVDGLSSPGGSGIVIVRYPA
jgi:hypothetical protein